MKTPNLSYLCKKHRKDCCMKISYTWLKDYIDFEDKITSPQELADVLTALGLEVEGIEKTGGVPGNLEGIVVGYVEEREKHPNSDHLSLCKVNVGGDNPLSIVCGAPNVDAGQKVPVALVGTMIYPEKDVNKAFKIKKSKIRGAVSMGMICSERELNIGDSHEGIMVLSPELVEGTPMAEVIELDEDYILEIGLTPNRIDGASHYGTARDLAAYLKRQARFPELNLPEGQFSALNPIPITIAHEEKCQRYTGIYIEGVRVKESPEWLQNRLVSIGLRPINNIVDITNYVMMELGQPLHAFDADELSGGEIVIKTLEAAQDFETLDGIKRKLLVDTDLMICDAERPLCIAGVMGGLNSGVTEKTQNIFLESAYFEPGTVRRTAKRLGLSTDSSFRFERGADPHMAPKAAIRAACLIIELAGGTASAIEDVQVKDFPPFEIDLSIERTQTLIGQAIPKAEIIAILQGLEIEVEEKEDGDMLALKVPPYRVDVQRPQDVMEEILRVYGYNNIEIPTRLNTSLDFKQYKDTFRLKQNYSNALSSSGYYETLTNSLVSKEFAKEGAVFMLNPLSEELAIMRQSVLPNCLEVIAYNQNRKNPNLACYEFAKTYNQHKNGYKEDEWLCMFVTGQKHATHWESKSPKVSLHTLSKEVERLQKWFNFSGTIDELEHEDFAYGLKLRYNKKEVLRYGKLSQEWVNKYSIRNEVFFLQANWEALTNIYFDNAVSFQPIPVYPSITRDLSLLLEESISFQQIEKLVMKCNPKLIREVALHDVYKGKNIEKGKKSYLISITLQDHTKTLQDKAADKLMSKVSRSLSYQLGAEIRK